MIELYIGNRKIDITDDLEVNFTYESIDGEKLSNIKNSFSKTVNIPGTANNNITFGHIFRFDKYISVNTNELLGEGYDPHKRVPWFINRNGAVINSGYCTLDNIIMKNEREITYQMTLYGGIGEFFYSLAYNEDGSPKTLYDMFWNWYPKTSLIGHGAAMNEGEEATNTLFNCSAEIVASTYHELNPTNLYTGTTDIDKDIVFVPCYTGLYENFDSRHILVTTFNQNYNSERSYLSTDTIDKLHTAFPDSYTDADGKTYTTLNKNFTALDSFRYGLVNCPRDVDAWEAGDLRVNELPVAVRLSKLMTVISNQQNNGGYEVDWDDDIKNSWHWLYGWVLLGKLKKDTENLNLSAFSPSPTYDGQHTTINVDISDGSATTVQNAVSYDIPSNITQLASGDYRVNINVYPQLTFRCDGFSENYPYISGSFHYGNNDNYRFVWTTSVLVHKIYDGNNLIKSIADVFYFSTNPTEFYYGYNYENVSINDLKTALNGKINERFMNSGEFIDEYRYHNCKLENPDVSGEGYIKTVAYTCGNVQISTNITTTTDTSNFRVEQSQGMMWTNLSRNGITAGKYGTDAITFNYILSSHENRNMESPFGMVVYDYYWQHTKWAYNNYSAQPEQNYSWVSFRMNTAMQNGVLDAKSSGSNILQLDKKTLFANSQSPMKYLSGYCKMMNYRFICDNVSKRIQVKTLKNYYIDRTIDINDRVDIGRGVNIKNVTTPHKTINIGLRTAETYPVSIFNRVSRDKFNTVKYNTGIKYNASETNLLDDLTYENLIDWQQSSIYYNNNPQFPKPYNVQSISWTLFNVDSQDSEQIEKKEIFTPGTPSNSTSLLATYDFLPKIALFDKDNKTVDFESSLIFLNGFVKNYDYTNIGATTTSLTPNTINESHYINTSGTVGTTSYQDIYIYNVNPNAVYYVTASYSSSYGSFVVNYYNSSGTRIGTEYSQANANLVDAELHLPNGTETIRCNYRKADTSAVLKAKTYTYAISPRVSLSNDMYEQYLFNQQRCYVSNFKYNDNFRSWGCYSSNEQKATAASWVLPMFTRDLYNGWQIDFQDWQPAAYKLASWNLTSQDGLDSIYNLMNTTFISNPDYSYSKTTDNQDYSTNEYTIPSIPLDIDDETRIYDTNWKDYLNDLYDRNTRDVTAYVDLSGLGDANEIMRNFYAWNSHLWIITKIENFKVANSTSDKFTKVKLHKIMNKTTWTH